LYIACGYPDYEDLVAALISRGADVKLTTNGGATGTMLAYPAIGSK